MIRLKTDEPRFFSDLGDVLRLFYGDTQIALAGEGGPAEAAPGDRFFEHRLSRTGGNWCDMWTCEGHTASLSRPVVRGTELEVKRARKRQVKQALYDLLRQMTGMHPPWGSLTGIRPTRLLYEAMEQGMTMDEAVDHVRRTFDVCEDRAQLLGQIARMQQGLREVPPDRFDLYIGIPFCRTRCSYCSFSAGEIGDGRLVEPYVQALEREIALCRQIIEERGLRLRAGYVGGGTPTAIPCRALERVLAAAMGAFPDAVEWTVEAGRPDTIDAPMLRMLRDMGVTRISVNPQTFNDETLRRVGRAHTGAQTIEAYELARSVGFDDINMDVIAALPGEDVADFEHTLDQVIRLAPDSVTVHSLAIKRSSRLHEQLAVAGNGYGQVTREGADRMIAQARCRLMESGWHPYYLYRQKYMAGNLENVGYAKRGKACLYNIGNMEETASVLALGAGAISKWLFDRTLRIERAPNVRNIEQYIQRVDEMVERKRDVIFRDPASGAGK